MKKQLLALFCLSLFFISCEEQKKIEPKKTETNKKEITSTKKTIETSVTKDKKIEKPTNIIDDVTVNLLLDDLYKIADNSTFEIVKKPKINIHNEAIIDTIKTHHFNKSSITSYKAKTKEFIYHATIKDSEFKFLDSIFIGVEKGILEQKFKRDSLTNTIKIKDFEGSIIFEFSLENNKLKQIDFECYID
ncbi:hypothetical protein [Aureivirga sp. CE67]|uniref:hypothetical protein n=1 Tax=Aureivirga sp. CE67 TaxID=1788983 RepID=UPI0018C92720|nr:hypothetical protein [Aureivirga sp. CE67]